MSATSFLRNPSVWSTVIALLAVILSQVPPLREVIKGSRVLITAPHQFTLYHHLGSIEIDIFLDIENAGGTTESVRRIDCVIKDLEGKSWNLPAKTYFAYQGQTQRGLPPQEFFIGSISLKPGEHWKETVHCYKSWTEDEQEKVNDLILKIERDFRTKYERKLDKSPKIIEVDPKLVSEAKDFLNKKFDLHKGNYYLLVAALSESNEVINIGGFEFTLYDSSINNLKAVAEDYKYGWGIRSGNYDPLKAVVVRVDKDPLPRERALKLYSSPSAS